jgi:hypothetical protein
MRGSPTLRRPGPRRRGFLAEPAGVERVKRSGCSNGLRLRRKWHDNKNLGNQPGSSTFVARQVKRQIRPEGA